MISRTVRLIRINAILMRYNIDALVLGTHWFYPLRFFIYLNPYYWINKGKYSRGERIRMTIEALGPIFVKAGQIVSTRRDLIPPDIADELAKLQDKVPPFAGEKARTLIEEALDANIDQTFTAFDLTPLASASIAQVHAATLLTGESVVIKVLRPNIRTIIDRDVDLLKSLAHLASRYWYRARHFKPEAIVEEISQTLYDELDLTKEAANASQLKRNFKHSSMLYIPKIYWEYTRETVMVMERIYAMSIAEKDALKKAHVNMQKLAKRGIEIFFTQVFRDRFFHADWHPGNIFVSTEHPENPTYIAVDFGIVGSLDRNDQRYLAENMIAFFKRDYQRVAELHIACGWLPPNTRIDQFEGAIRSVSEPIFEQPLRDISFGQLLLKLFQVARRFEINIQPQLILLQKTLLSIEGLSRQLAPDIDLWESAAPQIEKWLKKEVGIKAFLRRTYQNLPLWSEQLPELPTLIYEVLKEKKHAQEIAKFKAKTNSQFIRQKHRAVKIKYFSAGVLITLIIGGAAFWVW